jgi:transcriptional regulator with XRE-family HTH domain
MLSLNEQEIVKAFGAKIRQLRKSKKMSMQQLANIAEIELSQIYRIETGKINPKLTTIIALSIALESSLGDLFDTIRVDM